jgi:hypothetical protein
MVKTEILKRVHPSIPGINVGFMDWIELIVDRDR